MSYRAVVGSALLAALVAVVLTGCTAPEPKPTETPAAVQPSPEPSVDPALAAEPEPVDTGSIDGAEGEAVFYDDALVGYVVTYGDIISAIEQRFGVDRLASLNGVAPETIAPGDRLLLRRGAVMPDISGCIERSKLGFMDGGGIDGHWVFWIGPELVDRGASDAAAGTVATDSSGRIVAYTVAEGDGEFAIGDRFCLEPYSFMKYSGFEWPLDPGDVLKLAVDPADLFVAAQ
ncbi:MAG: LysM peptidoglycan-binding domain-containing protein [Microbacterium sp.]|uniref:LysM peptidoglycan-binding domain-containing protein n=1 Tax=Microbacterium sp. TaxID=51671 RepID=UPI001DB7CFD7|nr:LysM peptidoglycan-binding domain-containing protein [Microbacterium sp.]MBW8763881.1 LysM peptidoglycan-binding domain-containing protein [Microbacterium sp.]